MSDDTATDPAAEARIIRDGLRLTLRRVTETGDTYRSEWLGVPAIKYPTDPDIVAMVRARMAERGLSRERAMAASLDIYPGLCGIPAELEINLGGIYRHAPHDDGMLS